MSINITKTIALVGLMGAGKTSVGKRLAGRLNVRFVDADHEIELAAGCTIPEFFEKYGEEEFRRGEERVIDRILDGPPCILATGGGAFISSGTRALMKQKAISLWLRAEFMVLDKRLQNRSGRPLLKTTDPKKTLRLLMEERYPIYGQADIIVDSGEDTIDVAVDTVFKAIKQFLHFSKKSRLR